jgi:uncharacterized protein YndB with AHSA1/START domain
MKNTDEPIIVEQSFMCSTPELWAAIVERDQMITWFFQDITSFEPEQGFKTSFPVQSEDRIFTHLWEVTEVSPLKSITYKWKYEEYPGDSVVNFKIEENEGSIKLILTHTVLESFPDDIPEFDRESGLLGWQYFIQQSLKYYLEKIKLN